MGVIFLVQRTCSSKPSLEKIHSNWREFSPKMAGRGNDSDSEDEEPTIAEETVVTKYKSAGEIANRKWNRTAPKWTFRHWFLWNKPAWFQFTFRPLWCMLSYFKTLWLIFFSKDSFLHVALHLISISKTQLRFSFNFQVLWKITDRTLISPT